MEATRVVVFRPIDRNLFLRERVTCFPSTSAPHGASLSVRRRIVATRSHEGPEHGAMGRTIDTLFGPMFPPDGGGRENQKCTQEKRVRAQRDMIQRLRLHAVIAEQLQNGTGGQRDQDAALLREVQRRLRAQATTQQSDVDELVQQLEQRLGLENNNGKKQKYSVVYDYLNAWLKDWDQGLREGRGLQEQWEEFNEQRESERKPIIPSTTEEPSNLSSSAKERNHEFSTEELFTIKSKEEKKPDEKGRGEPLSDEPVVFLKNEANDAQLYLVGTSHVSKQSIHDVRVMIQMVKPDYVMVELDKKRFNTMMGRSQSRGKGPFVVLQHVARLLADGNIGMAGKLMALALFGVHRKHSSQGIRTGMEMRAAIEEGEKLGAQIVLGDQDFSFTLKRFGELMTGREAMQYLFQPLPKDLIQRLTGGSANNVPKHERLRDRKLVRKATKWLDFEAPAFNKVLLDERNEVMIKTLRSLSGKIVGVVGLAHLDGMEQLWHEANEKHRNESITHD